MKKVPKTVKIIAYIVLSLLLLYLGAEAGYQGKYYLERTKESRIIEGFNQAIIDMFRKDKYGGTTPEETYKMFIEALKNEDVDLAVKYFVLDPDRRAYYWKKFDDMKQYGMLKEYTEKWPAWQDFKQIKDKDYDWERKAMVEHTYYRSVAQTVDLPNGAGGYIQHTYQPGDYVDYSPVFVKNSNNVWKIEGL